MEACASGAATEDVVARLLAAGARVSDTDFFVSLSVYLTMSLRQSMQ